MKNLYPQTLNLLWLLALLVGSSLPAGAQQIQGAELTYTVDAANSLMIHGQLTAYTDFSHTVPDNPQVDIHLGADQWVQVQRTRRTILPDGYYKSIYLFDHVFPAAGTYPVSFSWYNREVGLRNLPDSENQAYWITTQVVLAPQAIPHQQSAQFLTNPIQVIPLGQTAKHHLGAYDPEGDSLAFELVPCLRGANTQATGYGMPDFVKLNARTGELTYTNPEVAGRYALAVKVTEYRNNRPIGYVMRDFTLMVKQPAADFAQSLTVKPAAGITITPQNQIFIAPNQILSLRALLQDAQADTSLFEIYSDLFAKTDKLQITRSFTDSTRIMDLTLEADSALQRRAPYLIVLRAVSRKDWDVVSRDKEYTQEKGYRVYIGSELVSGRPPTIGQVQVLRPFPNPATEVIYIDLPRFRPDLLLRVYNTQGQLVWQQKLLTARTPLRRQHFGAGRYVYRITPASGYEGRPRAYSGQFFFR